ncbi:MAG: hypothetical protein K6F73_05595, partial [Lachnospiraceae bacterium]|nr:hypothetical protein [Lachnospiraceae bacterium]
MKRRLMKLTAMLLAFAMTFGTDASLIAAAPTIEEASMPEEEPAAENTGDEVVSDEDVEAPGENDLADDDAETPDGKAVADETDETSDDKSAVSPEANSEETPDEDVIEAPDDENDSFFYRELSDEEEEAKEDAAADEEQVMEAAEGEDYAEGEVIALCDTEGEAEKIAEGYAKSTGYTVTVESFRYGVALLKISGRPSTDKLI